jgi:tRNA/rRNA methyltransferase
MADERLQDGVGVVLVRARNPQNIGAVARAMHDFGFERLRVVNKYAVPLEAARSAIDAGAVLGAAEQHDSVAEAVADCSLVVGTTAVGERALEHPLHALAEAGQLVLQHIGESAGGRRVALLIGSEKTGLSNEELSHCHWLLTIPMAEHEELRHPSMNLGQAVAVCLYELVRRPGEFAATGVPALAGAGELERMTRLVVEVLERTGYRRHHPQNSDDAHMRRLVMRLGIPAADAVVWMGVLRQILWHASQGREAQAGMDEDV